MPWSQVKSIAVTRVQLGFGAQEGRTCLLHICSLFTIIKESLCYLQHLPPFMFFTPSLGRFLPSTRILPPCSLGSSSLSFWSWNQFNNGHVPIIFLLLTFFDLSTSSVTALNISSTLILSLAEVSNNLIPIWSANLLASSVKTTYFWKKWEMMAVTWYSIEPTFLSGSSFLFPTKILLTTSQLASISCNHLLTLAKLSPLVTSYTTMTPCVPL